MSLPSSLHQCEMLFTLFLWQGTKIITFFGFLTGSPGPIGQKGSKGDHGSSGLKGERGVKGEKGDRGLPGKAVCQGLCGAEGTFGFGIVQHSLAQAALGHFFRSNSTDRSVFPGGECEEYHIHTLGVLLKDTQVNSCIGFFQIHVQRHLAMYCASGIDVVVRNRISNTRAI